MVTTIWGRGSAYLRVTESLKANGSKCKTPPNWNCPAHEDNKASLSVSQGDKGVVFNCHAGCKPENICEELGLRFTDLYDDPPTKPTVEARYEYQEAKGNVLRVLERRSDKRFQWQMPDGTPCHNNGNPHLPYQLPKVLKGLEADSMLWIVEGEKDVETLRNLGHNATTAPGGRWTELEAEALREHLGAIDLRIIADRDETGIKDAQKARSLLRPHAKSAEIWHTPLDRKGADVTDHLDAGRKLEDLVKGVPELDTPVKKKGLDFLDLSNLDTLPTDPPPHMVDTWLAMMAIVVFAGPPSAGKSMFALCLALHLVAGKDFLGLPVNRPYRVMYVDEEMSFPLAAFRIRGLVEGHGIPPESMERLKYCVGQGLRIDTTEGRARLEASIAHDKPDLVILDSMAKVNGAVDENSNTGLAEQSIWLQEMRHKYECTFMLLHHTIKLAFNQKTARSRRLGAIRGGGEIVANADKVWWAQRCDGQVEVSLEKDRSALTQELPVMHVGLDFDDPNKGPFRLVTEGAPPARPNKRCLQVQLVYLTQAEGKASTGDLESAVKEAEAGSASTADRVRKKAVKDGLLVKLDHGMWEITAAGTQNVTKTSPGPFESDGKVTES